MIHTVQTGDRGGSAAPHPSFFCLFPLSTTPIKWQRLGSHQCQDQLAPLDVTRRLGQRLVLEDQSALPNAFTAELAVLAVSIREHFACVGDSFQAPPTSKPLLFVEQTEECLFWGRLNVD